MEESAKYFVVCDGHGIKPTFPMLHRDLRPDIRIDCFGRDRRHLRSRAVFLLHYHGLRAMEHADGYKGEHRRILSKHSPLKPLLDKSWRISEIELVK
ncbi:MAG: hypothetical protein AB7F35_08945 [Acetobacteraceae bacterium]